jgi:hypothetical protein
MGQSEAENARLQERMEEVIGRGAWLFRLARVWRINIRGLRGMRDIVADVTEAAIEELVKRAERAEALAERRKEALVTAVYWRDRFANNNEDDEAYEALFLEDGCLDNEARTAIDIAPEEAREKSNGA